MELDAHAELACLFSRVIFLIEIMSNEGRAGY